jgi:hypothetical protein
LKLKREQRKPGSIIVREKTPKRKRNYISWKTKFAAAVAQILEIPYEHQILMSESMILSLIDVHHDPEPHAPPFYGSDDFHNLDIIGIVPHQVETAKKTTPTIAKIKRGLTKREQKAQELAALKIATEDQGQVMARPATKTIWPPFIKPKKQWPKGRKIQSRPFPKKVKV